MNRFLLMIVVLVPVFLGVTGCGSSEVSATNSAAPMTSVTMDQPVETPMKEEKTYAEVGTICQLKVYPGQEGAEVHGFTRNDSGEKYVVHFETVDSIEKVISFYKGDGFDAKVTKDQGSAMGLTKNNSSVIISAEANGGKPGSKVTVTAIHYPKK